jgi:hypothetical protein
MPNIEDWVAEPVEFELSVPALEVHDEHLAEAILEHPDGLRRTSVLQS